MITRHQNYLKTTINQKNKFKKFTSSNPVEVTDIIFRSILRVMNLLLAKTFVTAKALEAVGARGQGYDMKISKCRKIFPRKT